MVWIGKSLNCRRLNWKSSELGNVWIGKSLSCEIDISSNLYIFLSNDDKTPAGFKKMQIL